jgi:hypothetical protein
MLGSRARNGDAPVQAYIHRGHAGLENATSGAASTRSSCAPSPACTKAVKWNSPFYGIEGRG